MNTYRSPKSQRELGKLVMQQRMDIRDREEGVRNHISKSVTDSENHFREFTSASHTIDKYISPRRATVGNDLVVESFESSLNKFNSQNPTEPSNFTVTAVSDTYQSPAAIAPSKPLRPPSEEKPKTPEQTMPMSKASRLPMKQMPLDIDSFDLKTRARVSRLNPETVTLKSGVTYYWCTCGRSKNQPFCDGSHEEVNQSQGTSFQPFEFSVPRTGEYQLCCCKQTGHKPFCDGTHTTVTAEQLLDREKSRVHTLQKQGRVGSCIQSNYWRYIGVRWMYRTMRGFEDVPPDHLFPSIGRVCLLVAKGDGEIAPVEREWLIGHLAAYGYTNDVLEDTAKFGEDPSDKLSSSTLADADPKIIDILGRDVIYVAMHSAMAEGMYSDLEQEETRKLGTLIGITAAEIREIEDFIQAEKALSARRTTLLFPFGQPFVKPKAAEKVDVSAYNLKTRARVASRGPLEVVVQEGKTYQWCSCGHSKKQPFCDGACEAVNEQMGTNYKPVKYVAKSTKPVLFCGCKRSSVPPFCDSSHKELPLDFQLMQDKIFALEKMLNGVVGSVKQDRFWQYYGIRWFLEYMYNFQDVPCDDEQLNFAKACLIVAKADGELAPLEKEFLLGYLAAHGHPDWILETINSYEGNERLEDILDAEVSATLQERKREIIYVASMTVQAKGFYHKAEKEALRQLSDIMEVDESMMLDIEGMIEEEKVFLDLRKKILYPKGLPW